MTEEQKAQRLAEWLEGPPGAEPPEGWRFEEDAYGKPEVVRSAGAADLRFNISHCEGIVAAAFSLGRNVGVDVESVEHVVDYLDVARSQFAAAEVELLEALPEIEQRGAFFSLWTLKEAYQ